MKFELDEIIEEKPKNKRRFKLKSPKYLKNLKSQQSHKYSKSFKFSISS